MNCFEPSTRRRLARAGFDGVAANIERMHTRLLKQQQPFVNTLGNPSEEGVTVGLCLVLWQAGLHRVERLLVSAGSAIGNGDVYGLAVLSRALLESTAVIASICAQLHQWAEGKSTHAEFDAAVTAALAGSRSSLVESNLQATNILTHIKRADRFIDERNLFLVNAPLATMYDALSEYAHPNMSSNACAFEVREDGVFHFNRRSAIAPSQLELIGMLASAAQIYLTISEFFHGWLTGGAVPNETGTILPWPANGRTADHN